MIQCFERRQRWISLTLHNMLVCAHPTTVNCPPPKGRKIEATDVSMDRYTESRGALFDTFPSVRSCCSCDPSFPGCERILCCVQGQIPAKACNSVGKPASVRQDDFLISLCATLRVGNGCPPKVAWWPRWNGVGHENPTSICWWIFAYRHAGYQAAIVTF